ncbi:G-protein coupled receptor family C group 5 member B-like isoform X2 [Scleropages formosus]|uniref:G-protein coupled receptor family C group 5 member B-like isoform X2 n=1 Tax=Scleropages formosus TaxID=113540 RepID=UPI0010FA9097|nr:G-protein coupled receptor family C group 5 member B isoform X2 [Scleropages formosus]
MTPCPLLLFLLLLPLCMVGSASTEEETPPRGCSPDLQRPFRVLCDLEAVWGVVLEAVAAGGVLAALLLCLVLLFRLRHITEAEKRSGVAPLLLLLAGLVGLFGLSFAFLIEHDEHLCVVRRALWGLLFALCFSCLLAQGVRLQRLARGKRSPGGIILAGLALGLTLVQGIIAAEWLLLTVARQGQAACQYLPLDFALACSYVVLLLLAALVTSACALCGGERPWRGCGLWLFLACLASVMLWAAWLGFYLYGNAALGHSPDWDEPALAVALVVQGWLLLLLHAIPEAHSCLRPPPPPSAPDYFDATEPPPRLRETSFYDDLPLQYMENQAFSFDEHSSALRSGVHRNGNLGIRSGPFRSNVYQPTEMAVVLNGGTEAHCRCPSMYHSPPGMLHDSHWRYCPFGGNRYQLHPPTTQGGSCGERGAGDQGGNQSEGLFLDANKNPMHYFVLDKEKD